MMMTPLIGYVPDADSTTAGVITDCSNLLPDLQGMSAAPSPMNAGIAPLPQACSGAAVVTRLDAQRRLLAGTRATLYEWQQSAWADVVAGGAIESDARWSLAQYGNTTLAANGATKLLQSDAGAFAPVASAPVAKVVFTVGAFVMALNTSEEQDQWHCCAAYDAGNWVTSIDTQCAKGRLVATNGALTAGARLGEYAIAYKAKSMYIGQYVGAPAVWQWAQVAGGDAGCVGQDALCDIGGAHFFVGESGLFLFDGTRPVPVADGQVRQWFFDTSHPQYRYKTQCVYDGQNDRVFVFFPSKGSSENDMGLVWHVKSKRWGRCDMRVQAALNYIASGITYDTLDKAGASYDALPLVAYDSQSWMAGGKALAVFNQAHQLQTLTGAAGESSLTTGDYGDDAALSRLKRLRVRYLQAPDAAQAQVFAKRNSGEMPKTGKAGQMRDGKFDVMQTARWHSARFTFQGDVRVSAMGADFVPAGMR